MAIKQYARKTQLMFQLVQNILVTKVKLVVIIFLQ
jgi:hypothetical protein